VACQVKATADSRVAQAVPLFLQAQLNKHFMQFQTPIKPHGAGGKLPYPDMAMLYRDSEPHVCLVQIHKSGLGFLREADRGLSS